MNTEHTEQYKIKTQQGGSKDRRQLVLPVKAEV